MSAILDSVGTLVVVLDPQMRVVRFNRVCEETTGHSFTDIRSRFIWDLLPMPDQAERFRSALEEVQKELDEGEEDQVVARLRAHLEANQNKRKPKL